MPKSLTNFNAPDTVRQRFDAICQASGRTRTSVLVELMTDYILHQSKHLATRSRANNVLLCVNLLLEIVEIFAGFAAGTDFLRPVFNN